MLLAIKREVINRLFDMYNFVIKNNDDLMELIKFLRSHTSRHLHLFINNKKVSFNSIAGRKKFASGLDLAAKILNGHLEDFAKMSFDKINKLSHDIEIIKEDSKSEALSAQEIKRKYVAKLAALKVQRAAWADRVTELEEACEFLLNENKKLKK